MGIKGQIPWNKGKKGLQVAWNFKGGKQRFPKCLTCNKQLSKYSAKHCRSHRPISKKTRKLLSKARMGNSYSKGKNLGNTHGFTKGFTPWNKGKPYLQVTGSKQWNWQGGISQKNRTERENIMSSLKYVNWRRAVFTRDNYTCVLCGAKKVILNADHIKPFALFPKLRLIISNGRTLCVPCHKKVTFSK